MSRKMNDFVAIMEQRSTQVIYGRSGQITNRDLVAAIRQPDCFINCAIFSIASKVLLVLGAAGHEKNPQFAEGCSDLSRERFLTRKLLLGLRIELAPGRFDPLR